jgi:hypothetical protein
VTPLTKCKCMAERKATAKAEKNRVIVSIPYIEMTGAEYLAADPACPVLRIDG